VTTIGGELALSSGNIDADGDSQHMLIHLQAETTNATITEMLTGTNTTDRITLAAGDAYTFDILVTGQRTDAGGETIGVETRGVIRNNGGTTALVAAVTQTILGDDGGGGGVWAVLVDADDTNDALRIQVTGESLKTITWTASVRISKAA
jgi:hypothetical protein